MTSNYCTYLLETVMKERMRRAPDIRAEADEKTLMIDFGGVVIMMECLTDERLKVAITGRERDVIYLDKLDMGPFSRR
jgi:hypothetical protein